MIKQFTTSVLTFKKIDEKWLILLIFHKKFKKWMVPGGHIENIENPCEAAIREVKEETGIEVKLITFKHSDILKSLDSEWLLPPEHLFQQVIPSNKKESEHIHLDMTYVAVPQGGELKLNEKETKDVKWFSVKDIYQLDMFDGTLKLINYTLKQLNNGTNENQPKKIESRINRSR